MTVPSGNNETVLDGVLKDVFEALTYSLKYRFLIEAQQDRVFGGLQPDGTYSGMIGALARKEVDLAGPFVASEERSAVADFTNGLEFSRLGIITGIESADRNMFLYFRVFSWQVWVSLMSAVGLCAAVSALLCSSVTPPGAPPDRSPGLFVLTTRYCWVFWSYLIGHDAGIPRRWSPMREVRFRHPFRILLAAWLVGPVINSLFSFQGSVTSTFAVARMTPVVSGLDELADKEKVVPVISRGSAVEICFKSSPDHGHLWERMRNHTIDFTPAAVEATLVGAEEGTHVLIVDYIYALGIASDWVRRSGRCALQVEELPLCQAFIALALAKGEDPATRRKIDSELTYVLQAKLTDRWLNRVLANYTHCTRLPSEGSKPLAVTDVAGGLVLWAAGVALAALLLFGERAAFARRSRGAVGRRAPGAHSVFPSSPAEIGKRTKTTQLLVDAFPALVEGRRSYRQAVAHHQDRRRRGPV